MLESLGKMLMVFGVLLFVVGGLILLLARLHLPLGRLPGDIVIRRDNLTCIFPLATSILLSLGLTLLLNLIARFLNRP